MRKKMSFDDLKALFPEYVPHKFIPLKATKKGYAHKHNPTYKPPKAAMTPHQWHKANRAAVARAKGEE